MGASVMEVEAVRYTHVYSLQEELERYQTRVYSDTWKIPDDIYEESIQEVRARIVGDYGSLDQKLEEEVRFAIDVVRFES